MHVFMCIFKRGCSYLIFHWFSVRSMTKTKFITLGTEHAMAIFRKSSSHRRQLGYIADTGKEERHEHDGRQGRRELNAEEPIRQRSLWWLLLGAFLECCYLRLSVSVWVTSGNIVNGHSLRGDSPEAPAVEGDDNLKKAVGGAETPLAPHG